MSTDFKKDVDRLFNQLNPQHGAIVLNPVTESKFVWGVDPIEPQKYIAEKALRARAWFRTHGPVGIELPLSRWERDRLKRFDRPVGYVVSMFGYSIYVRDFEVEGHPLFPEFAAGALTLTHLPTAVRENPEVRRLYPPRPLPGLDRYLIWQPVPKNQLA